MARRRRERQVVAAVGIAYVATVVAGLAFAIVALAKLIAH
jgi:hypothetical protein